MKRWMFAGLLTITCLLCACGNHPVQAEIPTAEARPAQTPPPEATALPETTVPEPAPEDFVRVLDFIPAAQQELMYATDRNFTGQVIYEFSDAYLRYGTVKKLMAVSEDFAEFGGDS